MAIQWLLDHADVDLLIDDRVYPDGPIEDVIWPFGTVARIAGVPQVHHWLDLPELQVAGWAETRAEARDICETMVAALHDIEMSDPLGVVGGCEDISGPRPLPDSVTSRPRFVAEVRLTVHPRPQLGS
jgi:hypothetical protein